MRNPMIIDKLFALSWFGDNVRRRVVLAAAAGVLAVLTFFPRSYEARTVLTPREPFMADGYSTGTPPDPALPGGRASVDVTIAIARSNDVRIQVAKLVGRSDAASIAGKTQVRALRAGIIEITAVDRDRVRALRIVQAYAMTLRRRLDAFTADQIANRRAALQRNYTVASARLTASEAALAADPNNARLASQRGFALRLRNSYTRFIDYTARDEIVGDGTLNILETPNVEPGRRLNMPAFLLLALIIVAGCGLELYLIRPPRRGRLD